MVRNAYKVSVESLEGNSTLGRPGCSWKSNVKLSLNQRVGEDVVWIYLIQERVLKPVIFKAFGYH